MERPLRPAGRLPRPARRPLARLRATHQGPYRAREGATRGACPPVDYGMTRVKHERYTTRHGMAPAQLKSAPHVPPHDATPVRPSAETRMEGSL